MTQVDALLLVALAIGAIARLLKTSKMSRMLSDLGLPPIPKRSLPWISAALGVVAAVVEATVRGIAWDAALRGAVHGLLAGALATWGHEAIIESARRGQEVGVTEVSPPRDDDDGPAISGP